jgi:hypothetical protein
MIKKIFGILFCMLFITTTFSSIAIADDEHKSEIVYEIQSKEQEKYDLNFISKNYKIELNGKFDRAFHFIYRKTINKDEYSIGISIIRFNEAEISINDGEITEYGNGILLLYRFRGIYDHDSMEDTLIINGIASFLKLRMIR